MYDKRFSIPALIMGILNLVVGLPTMACNCCQGTVFGGLGVLFSSMSSKEPELGEKMQEVLVMAERNMPGFVPFLISSIVVSFVLATVLVVAGIGLLCMKNWARWLSIFYASATILTQITMLAYMLFVVSPGMANLESDMQNLNNFNRRRQPNPLQNNPIFNTVQTTMSVAIQSAYAIALLIMMLLPNVAHELTRPLDPNRRDGRRSSRRRRTYDDFDDD